MRVLVTGGAGFIGSNLTRLLLSRGHDVVILDDLSTGYRANIEELPITFVEGSLLDPVKLSAATEGVDSVVHLGALGSVPRSIKDPVTSHQVNTTGTLLLLEECRKRGIGHLIMASSSSVYGMNPALPKSEREWVRPMSPYAVSKLAAEQYMLAYQQSYGFDTLAFRFFNVFGPRQMPGHAYAAVIPSFLSNLLAGKPLTVHGDGTQSRDFTYVGTLCAVIADAVERRVSHPEPVNLAFGTNTNLLTLIGVMEEVTGLQADIEFAPRRAGDVPHSQADNTSLRSLFPEIEPTPLKQGIVETVEWFREVQL